jgi:hypothetical protein
MSNTPETEVLRISGNVTVDKTEVEAFSEAIRATIGDWALSSSVNIVPQDDPSGMRLYRVEEVEAKDKQISVLQRSVLDWQITNDENQKLFKKLSEELAQEREKYHILKNAYEKIDDDLQDFKYALAVNVEEMKVKDLVIHSLRNKESRWRTFIKWVKGWFNTETPVVSDKAADILKEGNIDVKKDSRFKRL